MLPQADIEMTRRMPAARSVVSAIKVCLAQAAGVSHHTSDSVPAVWVLLANGKRHSRRLRRELMRKALRILTPAFVMLMTSAVVHAEPFTILPNGDLVFNTSISTTGSFICGSVVSCTGSGSSITLQSGGGTATFSFTGVNTSFVAGNETVPVTLGTFDDSATAGFSVPNLNPNFALFSFALTLSQSSPVVASDSLTWRFNPSFTVSGDPSRTDLVVPSGPQPPPYQYNAIVYTFRSFPVTLPLNGSTNLVADVGAVPEPTTMLLAGTGLIVAFVRRRKRTSISR